MLKINYNEKEKSIEINDGLQSHFFLVKTLLFLTLTNSIINLLDIGKTSIGLLEIVWIFLGLFSLIVLYSLFIKQTSLEKIPVAKIIGLKEKKTSTKKQFYLELLNGKKRSLKEIKTDKDLKELRKLLSNAGIKTKTLS